MRKMTPPKAPRRPRVERAKPWLTQVEADRRILKRVDAKGRPGRALAAAAPRLADSQYAEALDHVLARAFYLLQEFPGRFAGDTVWVQRDQDRFFP